MTAKDQLRNFILTELNWQDPPDDLTDDFPLVSRKAIDSLDTMRLLVFIEREFGIRVPPEEVIADNFGTLLGMARLVDRKLERLA